MRVGFVDQDKLLDNLKKLGFYPQTVFDVGVAKGTPWLYNAYPDSYFYLFEPVSSFDSIIFETLEKKIRGEHIKLAVGSKNERTNFYIPQDEGQHQIATFSYTKDTVPKDAQYDIDVVTLDTFTQGLALEFPIFLKTDVQGHDLEVAKGAINFLKTIDVVVTEAPLYGPWGGGAEVKDYMDFYYANNFILYDMVEPLRRPVDDRLHSIDLCFVNLDSPIATKNLYTSGKETLSKSILHYSSLP